MIKNLLNADEEPPEGTKVTIEDTVVSVPAATQENTAQLLEEDSPKSAAFEIPTSAQFFVKPSQSSEEKTEFEEFSSAFDDIEKKQQPIVSAPDESVNNEIRVESAGENAPDEDQYSELLAQIEKEEPEIFSDPEKFVRENTVETEAPRIEEPKNDYAPSSGTLFQSDYAPPSSAETIRNSGLAWSAGIVLFGSVIFMMIFGWFADLLLGSSPWGLVGGVILGGLIGTVQLFRISSQIYRK